MNIIPLIARGTREIRGFAWVDDEDYDQLAGDTWRLSSTGYARRGIVVDGKIVQLRMHREILGLAPGDPREVDHINGRRLDNRRSNLRIVSGAQNKQNRSGVEGAVPFRGVTFDRSRGKYAARATIDRKMYNLGRFDTAEEAAAVAAAFRAGRMPYAVA